MFEAAELGRTIPKEEYKARIPTLRTELLETQRQLINARFSVIVVFAGVDGAGKGETVNLLNEWMDPRWIVTRAYREPSDEEGERPEYWRYWRDLPPKGRIGLFLSSWYSRPVLDRVYGRSRTADLDKQLERIAGFERTLTDDGALILKFWMHLGKSAQKKRLRTLEKDPITRWRVTKRQWRHWRLYDKFVAAAERVLRRTSTIEAPWTIVEGVDEAYRSLTVARSVRNAIRNALAQGRGERQTVKVAGGAGRQAQRKTTAQSGPEPAAAAQIRGSATAAVTILSSLDMSQAVSKKAFATDLEKYQGRLNLLQRKAEQKGVSTILVFEGSDAAGKGGAIRRVTGALDARSYQVIPIAAPTDEERAHHYLWRFWRHLSRAGRLTIFDRSWYGRVLVERVEGFATEREWRRAYSEIDEFEEQLVDHGIVLVKYWVHISQDEQFRRFKEREKARHKQWKLTDEDWRNRAKWADYERAVNDMVERTSTRVAPWTLVEGNDKYFARLKVLKTACSSIRTAINR
ncbi:MAG: polyphosphate:AMP phosphotransferase [Acidobacteria bacterium]|nr:polyphosphate:AMP phosphotransferase [Acidobacteriota bacterium]MCA1649593.1 polyphosphate:AMP phosphotransferase [Acidobacteriota bacterium]